MRTHIHLLLAAALGVALATTAEPRTTALRPVGGGLKQDSTRPLAAQGSVNPVFYCTGRATSIGCLASITTTNVVGQPVSGANDYSVIATGVHGFKPGLMFFGINGPAAIFPWAGGYLCMNPPLGRGVIQLSGGSSPVSCDGLYAQVVNDGGAFHPMLDQGPGVATWFQYWYREPMNGAGALGTGLSNAVELVYAGP